MTDRHGEEQLIPLDEMTDDENMLAEFLAVEFYKSGKLDEISDERTQRIVQVSKSLAGLDEAQASRFASHFNAATRQIIAMDEPTKQGVYKAIEAKQAFWDRLGISP